ncbi:MAG: hypothetical protein RL417_1042 [Pseudomonadota bacterium]|jgi:hypothetical protein
MNKIAAVFVIGLSLGALSGLNTPAADAAPTVESSENLPKSGDLAASLSGGYGSRELQEPWGGVDERGEESSPITGSISKKNSREWVMRVFNNSDDPYSVQVQVNMYGRTGGKTKTDTYSYTLKSKSSTERSLLAPSGTEEARLALLSWKNLAPKTDAKVPAKAPEGSTDTAKGTK